MASVMGFWVSPFSAINTGIRHRCRLQARRSCVLSSDTVSASGASPFVGKEQNASVIVEEEGNGQLRLRDEEKIRNSVLEQLAPLWDDGYGTQTVEDYFIAAKELSKSDGGPPRWFCPVECTPPLKDPPILLFLPGLDGTGLGLILHHKALRKAFEVRCLHIPVHDRTPFEGLVKLVEEAVKVEHGLSPNKPIYLVGDSFGGCLALAVASRNPTVDLILILVNPATSFGRSQLQPLFPILEAWPDGMHATVPLLLSFVMGVS